MLRAGRVVSRGLAALVTVTLLVSCASGSEEPVLRVMVPNAPGGGYDTTARMLASVAEETGVVDSTEVFNLPGAGGVVGLSRLSREDGDRNLLMMMGLGVVGALGTQRHGVGFDDVTPVARILSEPDVVLVRTSSGLDSMAELARHWRRHPGRVRIGGGSLPGGPDHLATYQIAQALGIPPGQVRYRRFDGGGPLLASLFAGKIDVVVSGVLETIDQVQSGAVRPLAVTARQRLDAVAAPTLREAGVEVVFENWRGLLAPPGLSAEQRRQLVDVVRRTMATPEWETAEERNGWLPRLLTGPRFARFLAREERRTRRLLDEVAAARGRRSS